MFQSKSTITAKKLVHHTKGTTFLLRWSLPHRFLTNMRRPDDVLLLYRRFHAPIASPISIGSANAQNQSYQHNEFVGSELTSWSQFWRLGALVTATGAMISSHQQPLFPSCCEENEDDGTADDPYDDLPEKDEPTHCSICLTYRQGPCRPYWRKVEACTKDNEIPDKSSDNDDDDRNDANNDSATNRSDPPCLKYMMPWIDCVSGYRNLYTLIELDNNYTEGIADLEATASQHFCWAPSSEPSVDWTPWQDYVELLNPDWKLPRPSGSSNRASQSKQQQQTKQQQHFWTLLDQSEDPEIVQVEATVATTLDNGDILECAYALDQDKNVIGFVYGTKPSEASNEDHAKDPENSTATMKIQIVPNRTRHVILAAAYTHVQKDKQHQVSMVKKKDKDDNKDDALESHVYQSRPFQLDVMADRNTKINVASV